MILHLLINIVSTSIVASSNYFMQVLSSPCRMEISKVHSKYQALDIGIPSLRNLRFVSYFKSISWLVLLVSSIPIHLLFNSSVFETTFQGSEWQITIGTESFLNGTPFFPPGASLAPAGSWMPLCEYFLLKGSDGGIYYCLHKDEGNSSWKAKPEMGFGDAIPLDHYWNASSLIRRTLDSTVNESIKWVRLAPDECIREYGQAKPRENYRDVVFIVDTQPARETGWARREVFNFTSPSNLSKIWDPHVPADVLNPLWYSTHCHATKFWYFLHEPADSNCQSLLGAYSRDTISSLPVPFNQTNNSIFPYPPLSPDQARMLGYQHQFQALDLQYCLAQPSPGQCRVGLSNPILLVIIICVFMKLTLCAIVAWRLPRRSLVTLGDAIESFILEPDSITIGRGTLDINDLRLDLPEPAIKKDPFLMLPPCPRIWRYGKPRRLNSATNSAFWLSSYSLFGATLVILVIGLLVSIITNDNSLQGSFGRSNQNLVASLGQPGYIGALLLANAPQLLLSLCYFTYNSVCTHLCIELEWNSYASSFRPLRVSYPEGEQITSYRLQMPYRYGVPFLSISVILHWLLSNSLFVFISEGGYWKGGNGPLLGVANQLGLSERDSLVAIGYSPSAILALLVLTLVLIPLPILVGFRKLPNSKTMVVGGSNSLVVAAACHCYISAGFQSHKSDEASFQHDDRNTKNGGCSSPRSSILSHQIHPQEANDAEPLQMGDVDKMGKELRAISLSKLKWGAMSASAPHVCPEADTTGSRQHIMHLGLGHEIDRVCEPSVGHWYAKLKAFIPVEE